MRDIFLDPTLQARFNRDGFVQVQFLEPDDVRELIALHDQYEGRMPAHELTFTMMSSDADHRRAQFVGLREVMRRRIDRVLDRCQAVVGNFFLKRPGDTGGLGIHQDWSFVDEQLHQSLTIWCPLAEVNETNGTLSLVPGSHRLGSHVRAFMYEFDYPHLEPVLKARYSHPVSARPGEAIMFHQRLFHWSGPNRTPTGRLAANCFVAPVEAQVVFPYRDAANPDQVELFAADDEVWASFALGGRPANAPRLAVIQSRPAPLTEADLERELRPYRREVGV